MIIFVLLISIGVFFLIRYLLKAFRKEEEKKKFIIHATLQIPFQDERPALSRTKFQLKAIKENFAEIRNNPKHKVDVRKIGNSGNRFGIRNKGTPTRCLRCKTENHIVLTKQESNRCLVCGYTWK